MPDLTTLPKGARFTGLAIGNADISAGAVIGSKISTNAIVAAKITAGTITNAKLSSNKAYAQAACYVNQVLSNTGTTAIQAVIGPFPVAVTLVKVGATINTVWHSGTLVFRKNATTSAVGRITANAIWVAGTWKSCALSIPTLAAGDCITLRCVCKNSNIASCTINKAGIAALYKVAHTP